MVLVTAILSFLGSLLNNAPKLLEMFGQWGRDKAAAAEKTSKDTRNEQAIRDAARPPAP